MRHQARHEAILRQLEREEFVSVDEAARHLGVSAATVRRDFNRLAAQGRAERTHGGVRQIQASNWGALPFAIREVQYSEEKAALARAAAKLLKPRDVIMVDGGTTTFHLARCLPDFPLTVITNSLRLASALGERRLGDATLEVFLTGGYLFPEMGLLAGPQSIASLSEHHADCVFLSANGVCADGLFNPNEIVVETERCMIQNADRVVVLADHSKVGRRSMCRVCGLEQVDLLVTSARDEPNSALKSLQESGLEVLMIPA